MRKHIVIRVRNISYFVKSLTKPILDDVTFNIRSSEITAILGANGSGKTTLLKCLGGAIRVSKGKIIFGQKDICAYTSKELARRRAILAQQNANHFSFTVMATVLMGRNPHLQYRWGQTKQFSSNDIHIARSALEQVNASHLSERLLPTLSGGEQQRVHLARVLAQIWEKKNSVLFLDEPTAALDLKYQYQTLQLAKKLVKTQNMGIVCVLHDIALTLNFAQYVILLIDGKVFAHGTCKDVLTAKNIETVYDIPIMSLQNFWKQLSFN